MIELMGCILCWPELKERDADRTPVHLEEIKTCFLLSVELSGQTSACRGWKWLVGVCMPLWMCALEQRGQRLECPLSTPSADLFDLLAPVLCVLASPWNNCKNIALLYYDSIKYILFKVLLFKSYFNDKPWLSISCTNMFMRLTFLKFASSILPFSLLLLLWFCWICWP